MNKLSDYAVLVNPAAVCPVCGYKIDAATAVDGSGNAPDANSVGICMKCASYIKYNADLTVRLLTIDELLALPSDILSSLTKYRNLVRRQHK